jgi:MFS family permease
MRTLRRTTQSTTTTRDVRFLSLARGINVAGSEAGYIALLALCWELTGSASQASLVLLAAVAARLFGGPFGGWLGDHCDRRRVMIIGDVFAGVAFASFAFAQTMWQVVALLLLGCLGEMTAGSTVDAAVGNLVSGVERDRANATLSMARNAGALIGPVIGGGLVALVGARGAFLIDGGSSILAALLVLAIRGDVGGGGRTRDASGDTAATSDTHGDRHVLAGLRVIVRDPVLRWLNISWCCMSIAFAFVTVGELPLSVHYGYDEFGLGLIVMCWCAGALLGGWIARRGVEATDVGKRLTTNALLGALVFGLSGATHSFASVLVLMAIGGMSMSHANVVETTMLQARVDDGVRARVMATSGGMVSAAWGLFLAIGSLVIAHTSPQSLYMLAGGVSLISAGGFAIVHRLVRRERRWQELRTVVLRHALETDLAEGA